LGAAFLRIIPKKAKRRAIGKRYISLTSLFKGDNGTFWYLKFVQKLVSF
jgi:hypothetical protein